VLLLTKYPDFGLQTHAAVHHMNIVVIGSEEQAAASREKFGASHRWQVFGDAATGFSQSINTDVIFDFHTPDHPEQATYYPRRLSSVVFLDTTGACLAVQTQKGSFNRVMTFGFCGLPTFLNREILELSRLPEGDMRLLSKACAGLGTAFEVVADIAGLVSPRVICMIINEAYYTLEEGTATREDIDLAMKLGTNYPYGPFEWGDHIGLKGVVKVLKAAREEADDERYVICPLLLKLSGLP
jgi:3-hydroxybutyryl-CoA dehydrogenase